MKMVVSVDKYIVALLDENNTCLTFEDGFNITGPFKIALFNCNPCLGINVHIEIKNINGDILNIGTFKVLKNDRLIIDQEQINQSILQKDPIIQFTFEEEETKQETKQETKHVPLKKSVRFFQFVDDHYGDKTYSYFDTVKSFPTTHQPVPIQTLPKSSVQTEKKKLQLQAMLKIK